MQINKILFSDLTLYFHKIIMNSWTSYTLSANWFKSSLVLIFLDFHNINLSRFYIISFYRQVLVIIVYLLTLLILICISSPYCNRHGKVQICDFCHILLHCLSLSKEIKTLFDFLSSSNPMCIRNLFYFLFIHDIISFLYFWVLYLVFVC